MINNIEIIDPPNDTISSLSFSPTVTKNTYLAGTSWGKDIRCWEVDTFNRLSVLKAVKNDDAIVLSAAWSSDGLKVFTGSCDNSAKMWDLQSDQLIPIGNHDAPVKTVHHITRPNYSCVMTGSWDKTIKFWDLRQSNPLGMIKLPDKCFCADVSESIAVVSGSGRFVKVFKLDPEPFEIETVESPLKYQHRCIKIFLDKNDNPDGFAIGSIEGRVAIHYFNNSLKANNNFTFKCHRSSPIVAQPQDIYAVNDIAVHPIHMTLATVGSDGQFNFWDKDQRLKLKTPQLPGDCPISCCAIDPLGKVFAYALGYDWHKGHEFNDPSVKPRIFLHDCTELKPKK